MYVNNEKGKNVVLDCRRVVKEAPDPCLARLRNSHLPDWAWGGRVGISS